MALRSRIFLHIFLLRKFRKLNTKGGDNIASLRTMVGEEKERKVQEEFSDFLPINENKQAICNRLAYALMATRSFHNLAYLEYDPKTETVKAVFNSGYVKTANVCMDSGVAMIRDIIQQIV